MAERVSPPEFSSVVCKQSASLDGSRNVSTEESDCGVFKSFGPSNYKLNFSGLVDIAPDADLLQYDHATP